MPAAPDAGEIPQPGDLEDIALPGPGAPFVEVPPIGQVNAGGVPTLVGHQYAGQTEVRVDGIQGDLVIEVGFTWFVFAFFPLRTIGAVAAGDAVGGSAVVELTEPLSRDLKLRAINVVTGMSFYGVPRVVLDPGDRRGRPWLAAHPAEGSVLLAVQGMLPGTRASVVDANGVLLGDATAWVDGIARVEVARLVRGELVRPVGDYGQSEGGLYEVRDLGGLPWPAPRILVPRAGQTSIRIEGLRPGSTTTIRRIGSVGDTVTFTPAQDARWMEWPLPPLVAGDELLIWQFDEYFTASDFGSVLVTGGTTRPFVRPVLREGDVFLRIGGQVPGHLLMISVDDRASGTLRPAGIHEEVEISPPLVAGAVVTVSQVPLFPGVGEVLSDPVVVEPAPVLSAPTLVPYLFSGTSRALVLFAERGATVRLTRDDGVVVGEAWTGEHTSVDVPLLPTLEAGDSVTVQQFTGRYNYSPEPAPEDAVMVVDAPEPLPTPAILPPAFEGDDRVVVAGNPPGALVEVQALLEDGSWCSLGSAILPDPHGVVHLALPIPAGATLRAGAYWDGPTFWGPEIVAVADPAAPGAFAFVVEGILSPAGIVIGELTTPVDGAGALALAPDALFVVMAHGDPPDLNIADSYLGYRWLAEHLASKGMVVWCPRSASFISDSSAIEANTAILRADPRWPVLAGLEGALFGHSLGWRKVLDWLTVLAPVPTVRGLVGLGAQWEATDVALVPPGVPVLLVSAPQDYAFGKNAALQYYPDLPRPRAALFVNGGNHFGWNSVWTASALEFAALGGFGSTTHWPDMSITEAAHQDVGKAIFTSFLALKQDFDGWWRVFAGQLPPLLRAGPALRTVVQPEPVTVTRDGDLRANIVVHTVAEAGEDYNALGARAEGYIGTLPVQAILPVPAATALVWDVANEPDGVTEGLVDPNGNPLPFLEESSWVMHASSFDPVAGSSASPFTAVEPVLAFHTGRDTSGPLIRLLPEADFPAGFALPAGADVPLQVFSTPDDLAMGQTRAWPIRALLGLEPDLDLSSVSEATIRALVAPTSASAAVYGLEGWCIDL